MNTIQTSGISSLKSAIIAGIDSWTRAGEEVVKLLDSGMSLHDIEAEANCEFINANVLAQFERIGRKQVMPKLLVLDFPASIYLQKLPMSEQIRLVNGEVELLVHDGSPNVDTLRVSTANLTKGQCKQVFDKNGVRSLGAQRAWLEDQKKKAPLQSSVPTWRIKGEKVVFSSACEMSRHDLAIILAQMS